MRKRIFGLLGGVAVAAAVVGLTPGVALADTYLTSSLVKCVYPSGAYTNVQWVLQSNTTTTNQRRAYLLSVNEDMLNGNARTSGVSIDSISVAEINGGGTYGTGFHRDGLVGGAVFATTATEEPWVNNSIPVTLHWHLRRASNHEECVYGHAM